MEEKTFTFFDMKSAEEVRKYLNENHIHPESIHNPIDTNKGLSKAVYDIEITCGDWKHEHGYLDYLMEQIGYYKTAEKESYDEYTLDGDDCYSSVHRFVFAPFYELFNGKKHKEAE